MIDDHDQRSTICEKDGFNGLRAWGRSSGLGKKVLSENVVFRINDLVVSNATQNYNRISINIRTDSKIRMNLG